MRRELRPFRLEQTRVLDGSRRHLAIGDDHARAEPGEPEQMDRIGMRQADAAVRRRPAGDDARMQSDARHGEPLHVGHRGAAVDVGEVILLLVDDAEDAGRRGKTAGAGGDARLLDQAVLVEQAQRLAIDGDDDLQRPLRLAGGRHGLRAPCWLRRWCTLRSPCAGTASVQRSATSAPSSRAPMPATPARPAGPSPAMRRMRFAPTSDWSEPQLSPSAAAMQAGSAGIGDLSGCLVWLTTLQLAQQPRQLALLGLVEARRQLRTRRPAPSRARRGRRLPRTARSRAHGSAGRSASTSRRSSPRFSRRTTTGLMVDLSTPKAAASATCVMPGLARTSVSTPNEPGVKSKPRQRRLELAEDLGLRAPHLIADVGRQLVEIDRAAPPPRRGVSLSARRWTVSCGCEPFCRHDVGQHASLSASQGHASRPAAAGEADGRAAVPAVFHVKHLSPLLFHV